MHRLARLPFDVLLHGTAYGSLNYLIHNPEPLEEERIWQLITGPEGALRRALRKNYPPSFVRTLTLRRAARMAMEKAIPEHYDVSNNFYRLFLDQKYMFYSCADHITGKETLEEAQTNKVQHLLGLIEPQRGQRILELGCGWASMMRAIAEKTGAPEDLVGFTLSQAQEAYIKQRFPFEVRLQNFVTAEHPREHYDTIYSIAAWEAIRPYEADGLLRRLYEALKPGGRFVLHFFCRTQEALPPAAATAQLFFPGHVPMSYPEHTRAFERAGFRIRHTSLHDYRMTLRQWFENLVAHREEALREVGVRTYNRYVVFFAASWRYFDERTGSVFRFVLHKPAR